MATIDTNGNRIRVGDFCTQLGVYLTAMRNDFASDASFSSLTGEQQEAFFMSIALQQFDNCEVLMSDGTVIELNK